MCSRTNRRWKNLMERTPDARQMASRPCCIRSAVLIPVLALGWLLASGALLPKTCDAETDEERRNRIAAMTPQEKQQLIDKKERFNTLDSETQERLRRFHASISAQTNADQLETTLSNFYQWLSTLRPRDRDELLDPKLTLDKRIARIRELLKQQEDERFRKYVGDLPEEDREVLSKWMTEFVMNHEEEILRLMPREARNQYESSDNDDWRRGHLVFWWIWHYSRRNEDAPKPTTEDMERLIARFSEGTQQQINQAPTPEEREQRSRDLVRALAFSRFRPQVRHAELRRFYESMKRDDPRRERLEGLTGEELYRELARMHNEEPWRRGGRSPFGWGSRGGSRGGGGSRTFDPPGSSDSRERRGESERGKRQDKSDEPKAPQGDKPPAASDKGPEAATSPSPAAAPADDS